MIVKPWPRSLEIKPEPWARGGEDLNLAGQRELKIIVCDIKEGMPKDVVVDVDGLASLAPCRGAIDDGVRLLIAVNIRMARDPDDLPVDGAVRHQGLDHGDKGGVGFGLPTTEQAAARVSTVSEDDTFGAPRLPVRPTTE